MSKFGLVFSFGIDNGELDDFSRQQCFVLGYELAQLDAMLEKPAGFSKPVHAANADRISRLCEHHKREFSLPWMPNDSSETWMELTVKGT